MANKQRLSELRTGTVINNMSEKREGKVAKALNQVLTHISTRFREVKIVLDPYWYLVDIVEEAKKHFPEVDFFVNLKTSSMKPDGGILSIVDKESTKYPILITETKNQGTNDKRIKEGKPKQSKGNAVERLGKNVIGFRTALLHESIFPFICFGDGCDFAPDSSILDRVITISMFGKLNKVRLHNEGKGGIFNRGSFFFREKLWTPQEMAEKMIEIAEGSIYYYFSKYNKETFNVGNINNQ